MAQRGLAGCGSSATLPGWPCCNMARAPPRLHCGSAVTRPRYGSAVTRPRYGSAARQWQCQDLLTMLDIIICLHIIFLNFIDIIMADQIPTQNEQIKLRIIGDTFTPHGHSVSAYITEKFKERQCASGYTWKHVDPEMKEFYYKEFLKKYIWEPGHEAQFKATWNLYCQKQYSDLLYKWRKEESKSSHIPDDVWDSWQRIWTADKWKKNSIITQNNIKSEVVSPGTGVTKHTGGSCSTVEHAKQLEDTLQRPSNSWELFRKTHLRKDDTFVDTRSKNIDDDMSARIAQSSQPTIEEGESQTPSHDDINEMYYEAVGGFKKNSLYGLGSQAKVIYDRRLCTPRGRGRSSSSAAKFRALEEENELLKGRVATLEQTMQEILSHFQLSRSLASPSTFPTPPTPHGFDSQEAQDPRAPNE